MERLTIVWAEPGYADYRERKPIQDAEEVKSRKVDEMCVRLSLELSKDLKVYSCKYFADGHKEENLCPTKYLAIKAVLDIENEWFDEDHAIDTLSKYIAKEGPTEEEDALYKALEIVDWAFDALDAKEGDQ